MKYKLNLPKYFGLIIVYSFFKNKLNIEADFLQIALMYLGLILISQEKREGE